MLSAKDAREITTGDERWRTASLIAHAAVDGHYTAAILCDNVAGATLLEQRLKEAGYRVQCISPGWKDAGAGRWRPTLRVDWSEA